MTKVKPLKKSFVKRYKKKLIVVAGCWLIGCVLLWLFNVPYCRKDHSYCRLCHLRCFRKTYYNSFTINTNYSNQELAQRVKTLFPEHKSHYWENTSGTIHSSIFPLTNLLCYDMFCFHNRVLPEFSKYIDDDTLKIYLADIESLYSKYYPEYQSLNEKAKAASADESKRLYKRVSKLRKTVEKEEEKALLRLIFNTEDLLQKMQDQDMDIDKFKEKAQMYNINTQ